MSENLRRRRQEKKELHTEEAAEMSQLWRKLVKLFHPVRFAHEPEKQETYHQLTAAINHAKDHGDVATLRRIAEDPHGFILWRAGRRSPSARSARSPIARQLFRLETMREMAEMCQRLERISDFLSHLEDSTRRLTEKT